MSPGGSASRPRARRGCGGPRRRGGRIVAAGLLERRDASWVVARSTSCALRSRNSLRLGHPRVEPGRRGRLAEAVERGDGVVLRADRPERTSAPRPRWPRPGCAAAGRAAAAWRRAAGPVNARPVAALRRSRRSAGREQRGQSLSSRRRVSAAGDVGRRSRSSANRRVEAASRSSSAAGTWAARRRGPAGAPSRVSSRDLAVGAGRPGRAGRSSISNCRGVNPAPRRTPSAAPATSGTAARSRPGEARREPLRHAGPTDLGVGDAG